VIIPTSPKQNAILSYTQKQIHYMLMHTNNSSIGGGHDREAIHIFIINA